MSHTLHPLRRARLQRSELAVPGSNPEFIEKAAASDHQTTGSRPSSMRALLIMVPKLIIVGSTPIPT